MESHVSIRPLLQCPVLVGDLGVGASAPASRAPQGRHVPRSPRWSGGPRTLDPSLSGEARPGPCSPRKTVGRTKAQALPLGKLCPCAAYARDRRAPYAVCVAFFPEGGGGTGRSPEKRRFYWAKLQIFPANLPGVYSWFTHSAVIPGRWGTAPEQRQPQYED